MKNRKTQTVHTRMDKELKAKAQKIIKALGLTWDEYIEIACLRLVITGRGAK